GEVTFLEYWIEGAPLAQYFGETPPIKWLATSLGEREAWAVATVDGLTFQTSVRTVDVILPGTAPFEFRVSPGSVLLGEPVLFEIDTDEPIASVAYWIDGEVHLEGVTAPFSAQWTPPLTGIREVRAIATIDGV